MDKKIANEWGIVGFALALSLPLYKSHMGVDTEINYRDFRYLFGDNNAEEICFLVYFFFVLVAFAMSLKGVRKNREVYQMGLANLGLILNIFILVTLIMQIMSIKPQQEHFKDTRRTKGISAVQSSCERICYSLT